MEEREPKLGVAVGRKGVGKTFQTKIMINQYVLGNPSAGVAPRRALVLDVNDEFEDIKALKISDVRRFSAHPTIEARRIRPYNDNGMRMTLKEIQAILFKILNEYRGGLLLIEDINRYVSDSLPNDLIGAICTNRHTDTDIIMHFQSIGRITPKIWQNVNWLRFHKNTDTVKTNKSKFEDKFEYLSIAEIMVDQKYFSGDKRFFVYVDIDDEKLVGNITTESINKAVDEYIERYYKQIITPLINQKDLSGIGNKFTPQSAVEYVKQRIFNNHIYK